MREREKERERSLKGKIEKIERGDVPGVSGRTGPLSTTLEEHRRTKNKSGLKTGQRERERRRQKERRKKRGSK